MEVTRRLQQWARQSQGLLFTRVVLKEGQLKTTHDFEIILCFQVLSPSPCRDVKYYRCVTRRSGCGNHIEGVKACAFNIIQENMSQFRRGGKDMMQYAFICQTPIYLISYGYIFNKIAIGTLTNKFSK